MAREGVCWHSTFLDRAFLNWDVKGNQPYPSKQVRFRGWSPLFLEDFCKGKLTSLISSRYLPSTVTSFLGLGEDSKKGLREGKGFGKGSQGRLGGITGADGR